MGKPTYFTPKDNEFKNYTHKIEEDDKIIYYSNWNSTYNKTVYKNKYTTNLLLGTNKEFTSILYDDINKLTFIDKDYFNKTTESITIYNADIIENYSGNIINSNVLYVEVVKNLVYSDKTIKSRLINFVLINEKLYAHNKNLKRFPKEVIKSIEEYKMISNCKIKNDKYC